MAYRTGYLRGYSDTSPGTIGDDGTVVINNGPVIFDRSKPPAGSPAKNALLARRVIRLIDPKESSLEERERR